MEKNVGGYDRTARLVLGPILVLVGAAWFAGLGLPAAATTLALAGAAILALVGVVFAVTGYTQKCPLNSVLGMDTYRGGDAETDSDAGMSRPSD